MYKKDDIISIIDRNNASGKIISIEKYGGIVYYYIMTDSSQAITTTENNIRPYVFNPDPFDLFEQGNFQPKSVFSVASVINKMFGNNNDIIATLKSSKTNFLPYQFKPLTKFLKSDNRRILIADEVGLGKTIEAGYILAEMSLRGQIKNCLVICKSSLKEKWQTELREKFGFNFKIYNRKDLIKAIKEEIERANEGVFAIINYDYKKKDSNEFLNMLEKNEYMLDMLIIDEAHILRNANTIKHEAAKKLVNLSKNTILLTATPVMTSIENLYNLVKVIEPKYEEYKFNFNKQQIDFGYALFMDHLALSRPFIEAISRLNKGENPKIIIKSLLEKQISLKISLMDGTSNFSNSITVADRFGTDPLFISITKLAEKETFDNSDLALFQKKLSDLNSFQDIITRTRKREVQTDMQKVIRKAEKRLVTFSDHEMELYNSIIEDYSGEPLALVMRKRQATSCLPAYIERYKLNNELTKNIINNDSKFKEFKRIIDEVVIHKGNKLIVFSFFKDTLKYIEKNLNLYGIKIIRIDGDVPIDERQPYIDNFRTNEKIKILLSSEVGSEGLDMQFCHELINYDLPWNPMVVEQRIGRIDRIGQKSEVICIYNLCIKDSIEELIFNRLLDRIQIFSEAIGSLEDILTTEGNIFEQNEGLETQIYGHRLTNAAKEQKIKDIEIAIENAELMRKEIEDKLDDSFLNDQYLSDEINNINKQKRYVTPEDIRSLLTLLFQTRLATLRVDLDSPLPYIRWNDGENTLFDFIKENLPDRRIAPQLYNSYLNFNRKNRSSIKLSCTFSQEKAFEDKQLEFISPTHPLVQSAVNYFKTQNTTQNNAFAFCIDLENIPALGPKNSLYILAKYDLESLKYTMAKPNPDKSSFELQLLFLLSGDGNFVLMTENATNALLEVDIKHWYINARVSPSINKCKELAKQLRPALMGEFHFKKNKIETDLKEVHLSRQNRLIDTEIDFLNRQIERDSLKLKEDPDNTIRFIFTKRIKEFEDKINLLKQQKSKIKIELHEALQSLSIIQIQ